MGERDKEGRPKYTPRQALGLPIEPKPINVNALAMYGGVRID